MKNESILTIGSIALDTIYTKNEHRENILGGSASYFSIAASYFRNVNVLGVVGNDFPKKYWDLYEKFSINIDNSEYELSYSPTSIVTTVDKDIASPNNLDSLEKAYDVELKNVIEERHGLIGELSQELIEINIHAKLSMRCRTSKHAVDQSHESKHKLLMDSIKLVAKKKK